MSRPTAFDNPQDQKHSRVNSLWKKSIKTEQKAKPGNFVVTFDCDDTIVQYSPVISNCLYRAQQEFIANGIAASLPQTPTIFVDKTYEQSIQEAFTSVYQAQGDSYYRKHSQLMTDYPKHPVIPGALNLFRKILDAKIKIAIISNDKTSAVWRKLLQQIFPNNTKNNLLVENLILNISSIPQTLTELDIKPLSAGQNMWRQVILDFVNSGNFVILGHDLAKPKPDKTLGVKALEMLKISTVDPITVCHLGDGMVSDRLFAQNFDAYLKSTHPLSRCHFIYFGLQFDYKTGEAILSQEHLQPGQESDATFGYGGIGSILKHFLNPALLDIDNDALTVSKAVLKSSAIHSNKKTSFFNGANRSKVHFLITAGLAIAVLIKILRKHSCAQHTASTHSIK